MSRYQWERARKLVLERDEHQCVRCGHGRGLQVHHRRPRGAGGTSRPEIAYGLANLITLCGYCHAETESRRANAYRFGYLVRSSHDPAGVPVWLGPREWCLLTSDGEVTLVRDLPEEIA